MVFNGVTSEDEYMEFWGQLLHPSEMGH